MPNRLAERINYGKLAVGAGFESVEIQRKFSRIQVDKTSKTEGKKQQENSTHNKTESLNARLIKYVERPRPSLINPVTVASKPDQLNNQID